MTTAKARVLCVDDDSDLLDINTSILRMAGHEVLEASSGNDCLRLAKEQKPDLILLDVILPDIFGYDLCRQIKKDPELFGTYVMLISGQETSSNCQIKGLEAGADGYIVRPVSGKELLARVQAMIRIKQTEVALRNSMERYQMLVETMNDGLGALDEKGSVTFVNNKLCEMLGRSKDEITGCSVSDFLDNESRKIFREQFVKNRKGIEESYELTCLKKDGQKVFTIISPRVIVDEKGIFKGGFAVITDITGRRKAEEEIKRLNEELEKRVIQRTLQLEAVIKELENEIIQHKQTEEKLHNYAERLQALSKRLMEVQEAERRYMARSFMMKSDKPLTELSLQLT